MFAKLGTFFILCAIGLILQNPAVSGFSLGITGPYNLTDIKPPSESEILAQALKKCLAGYGYAPEIIKKNQPADQDFVIELLLASYTVRRTFFILGEKNAGMIILMNVFSKSDFNGAFSERYSLTYRVNDAASEMETLASAMCEDILANIPPP